MQKEGIMCASLKKTASLLMALLIGIFSIQPQLVYAAAVSRNLDLDGAQIHSMAASSDGSFVYATCQGPKGIFYSTDFGNTWNCGADDVYVSGEGSDVLIDETRNRVFVIAGTAVYYSPLTDPPAWTIFDITNFDRSPVELETDGNYLFAGTIQGEVVVYDLATLNEVFSVQIFNGSIEESKIEKIAIDPINSLIFACVGTPQGFGKGKLRDVLNLITYKSKTFLKFTSKPNFSKHFFFLFGRKHDAAHSAAVQLRK